MPNKFQDLSSFLEAVDLQAIREVLSKNDISLDILPELSDNDLREVGLSLGHRRRLQKAIAEQLQCELGGAEAALSTEEGLHPAGAERRQVTILFVDLVGSTELASHIDPEDLQAVLVQYQGIVVETVSKYGGHLAKYMGDGVLVYFGWPFTREDEVHFALRAALEVLSRVNDVPSPGGGKLSARAACATGEVVVGELTGEHEARERLITGKAPNLAARLQSTANPNELVVSETTRRLAGAGFEFDERPPASLKGFDEPVRSWRALAKSEEAANRSERWRQLQETPIFGREPEIDLFLGHWAAARAGAGQGTVLIGEAGLGKSRAMAELLSRTSDETHNQFVVQCSPYMVNDPFWPFAQLIKSIPERTWSRSQRSSGELTQLDIAALNTLRGDRDAQSDELYNLPPRQKRELTTNGLAAFFRTLAAECPVILILEDGHWADPATIDVARRLLSLAAESPMLVIVTSRPDNISKLEDTGALRLDLPPLKRHAVEDLIHHVAAEGDLRSLDIEAIASRTDGVPLFIEEVAKDVVESGPAGTEEHRVPATLHDALVSRLDRLGSAKDVAQCAACIGREFKVGHVRRVLGIDETRLSSLLTVLQRAGLVSAQGGGEETYFFKHALVRDIAYSGMLKARRREMHRAILDTISARDAPSNSHERLEHLIGAEQWTDAIDEGLRLASILAQAFANDEALSVLSRARDLLVNIDETAKRSEMDMALHLRTGEIRRAYMGYADIGVRENFRRAYEIGMKIGKTHDAAAALNGLNTCHCGRMELSAMRDAADALIQLGASLNNRVVSLHGWRASSYHLLFSGRLTRAQEDLSRALEFYSVDDLDDPSFLGLHPRYNILGWLNYSSTLLGKTDDCRTGLQEIARFLEGASPYNQAVALWHYVQVLALLDYNDELRVRANDLARIARQSGFSYYTFVGEFFAALADIKKAPLPANLRENILSPDRESGPSYLFADLYALVFADRSLRLGRLDDASSALTTLAKVLDQTTAKWLHAEFLRLSALLKRENGRPESEVQSLLDAANIVAAKQGAKWFIERIETVRG